jgi:hypothetical protein
MERGRSRSPDQLADSPAIERCPSYGHWHERLDQRIQVTGNTVRGGSSQPERVATDIRHRLATVHRTSQRLRKTFWNLVIGAFLGFGVWDLELHPAGSRREGWGNWPRDPSCSSFSHRLPHLGTILYHLGSSRLSCPFCWPSISQGYPVEFFHSSLHGTKAAYPDTTNGRTML